MMLFHTKHRAVLFGLGWPALAFLSLMSFSQPSTAMSEREREDRLRELRATVEQLKKELESVKSNRSELQADLQASETTISDLTRRVRELRRELENKQSRLQSLRSEKEALLAAKKQQQGSVGQQLNAAYRLGQQSTLRLLLNQQDPAQVSRNLRYQQYWLNHQTRQIHSYIGTLDRLANLEPEISAEVAAVERSHRALAQQREALLQQQEARKRTLAKLDSTIASTDAKLQATEEDQRNLEALLQRVTRVIAQGPMPAPGRPFAQLRGQLPWPAEGRLIQRFGSSRVANKMQWQGLLIGANEGSPVYAVYQGRVVFADYLRGQGLLMIVDHGEGYMSLYAHNQTLLRQLGEWVDAGEQIATVGQSGGQTQAGLYFELRYQGQPTNPQPWLRRSA